MWLYAWCVPRQNGEFPFSMIPIQMNPLNEFLFWALFQPCCFNKFVALRKRRLLWEVTAEYFPVILFFSRISFLIEFSPMVSNVHIVQRIKAIYSVLDLVTVRFNDTKTIWRDTFPCFFYKNIFLRWNIGIWNAMWFLMPPRWLEFTDRKVYFSETPEEIKWFWNVLSCVSKQ